MIAGNIAAPRPLKMAESRQRLSLYPLLLTFGGKLARK
ncbi:hypothetical protein V1279_000764 [Bradyrhizobium sp. AZCC 1610]